MRRGLSLLAATALAACHATGATGEGAAAPAEATAPASTAAPAPAAAQTVRLHLAPGASGRRRQFVPGLALSRIDRDAAVAAVPIPNAAPAGDAGSGNEAVAQVPGPGHYRASFLVARCAPDSPDGGCRLEAPKPDDVEFDMPAAGDLDIDVR